MSSPVRENQTSPEMEEISISEFAELFPDVSTSSSQTSIQVSRSVVHARRSELRLRRESSSPMSLNMNGGRRPPIVVRPANSQTTNSSFDSVVESIELSHTVGHVNRLPGNIETQLPRTPNPFQVLDDGPRPPIRVNPVLPPSSRVSRRGLLPNSTINLIKCNHCQSTRHRTVQCPDWCKRHPANQTCLVCLNPGCCPVCADHGEVVVHNIDDCPNWCTIHQHKKPCEQCESECPFCLGRGIHAQHLIEDCPSYCVLHHCHTPCRDCIEFCGRCARDNLPSDHREENCPMWCDWHNCSKPCIVCSPPASEITVDDYVWREYDCIICYNTVDGVGIQLPCCHADYNRYMCLSCFNTITRCPLCRSALSYERMRQHISSNPEPVPPPPIAPPMTVMRPSLLPDWFQTARRSLRSVHLRDTRQSSLIAWVRGVFEWWQHPRQIEESARLMPFNQVIVGEDVLERMRVAARRPLTEHHDDDQVPEGPVRRLRGPGGWNPAGPEQRLYEPVLVEEQVAEIRNESLLQWMTCRVHNFDHDRYNTKQYVYWVDKKVLFPYGYLEVLNEFWLARHSDDDRQQLSVVTEASKNICRTFNLPPQVINQINMYGPITSYKRWYDHELLVNSESRFRYYERKWNNYVLMYQRIRPILDLLISKLMTKYAALVLAAVTVKVVPDAVMGQVNKVSGELMLSKLPSFGMTLPLPRCVSTLMRGGKDVYYNLLALHRAYEGDPVGVVDTLRRTMTSSEAIGTIFQSCVVAPLVEELAYKRSFNFASWKFESSWWRTIGLIIVEIYQHRLILSNAGGTQLHLARHLAHYIKNTMLVHVLTSRLNPRTAILVHSLYNYVTMLIALMYYGVFGYGGWERVFEVSEGDEILSKGAWLKKALLIIPCVIGYHYFTTRKPIIEDKKPYRNVSTMNVPRELWLSPTIPAHYLENTEVVITGRRPRSRIIETQVPPYPDRVRASLHSYGLCCPFKPVVFAPNYHNELACIRARVTAPTLVPRRPDLTQLVNFSKKYIRSMIPHAFAHPIRSLEFEDYLKGSNASSGVKKVLRQCYDALVAVGVNENSVLTVSQLRQYTRRKSFVKVETNNYRSRLSVKQKAPRLIQGAPPEFICLVGPWIASLQKRIKRSLNVNNCTVFTSSVSARKLAEKLMFHNGVKCEDDVGKWDASMDHDLLEFEVWLVEKLGAPRAVVDLMRHNVDTHGVTFHGIKYSRRGCRKSGDPYTSLFNSLWNALIHIYVFCKTNLLTGRDYNKQKPMVMLVQGDDNAMSISRKYVIPDWATELALLGFESEAVIREDPLTLEFCSNRIYPVKGGYTFGPMPGKVLAKAGYYISPPNLIRVSQESMVRGTALGLLPACHHIAPLRAYLQTLLRLTSGHSAYYPPYEEWKMAYSECEETPETLASLSNVYGWNLSMQKMWEEDLSKCDALGTFIQSPVYEYLVDRDVGGRRTYHF